MLSNMFGELHKDFQQSIIFRDERWKWIVLWSELQENISRETLGYLIDEVCRADVIGTDKAGCRCLVMSTIGLSCSCALAKIVKEGKPIRLAVRRNCNLTSLIYPRTKMWIYPSCQNEKFYRYNNPIFLLLSIIYAWLYLCVLYCWSTKVSI
jgi:hypothetical protein